MKISDIRISEAKTILLLLNKVNFHDAEDAAKIRGWVEKKQPFESRPAKMFETIVFRAAEGKPIPENCLYCKTPLKEGEQVLCPTCVKKMRYIASGRYQAKLDAEKKAREEAERLEAERLEAERLEAERLEAERLEAERLEAERLEAERLEAERLEAERKAEEERLAREEAERLEAERLEAERLEAERLEAERLEAERLEAERLEAERLEAERLEAERKAEEERLAREEAERLEAERLEAERLEAERLEAERLEAERKAEEERLAREEAERLEAERLEAERLEAERLEAERLEAERLEAERLEAERLEAERLEAERLEAERKAEEERLAQEKADAFELEEKKRREEEERQAQEEAERLAIEKAKSKTEARLISFHDFRTEEDKKEPKGKKIAVGIITGILLALIAVMIYLNYFDKKEIEKDPLAPVEIVNLLGRSLDDVQNIIGEPNSKTSDYDTYYADYGMSIHTNMNQQVESVSCDNTATDSRAHLLGVYCKDMRKSAYNKLSALGIVVPRPESPSWTIDYEDNGKSYQFTFLIADDHVILTECKLK
ncbi:MAG: hypothetical protein MJZ11_11380 [Lachnospiraceae bacterium]|nr:hypothetical protein [Lachnospiraceae bacterium]